MNPKPRFNVASTTASGAACAPAGAIGACVMGACTVASCDTGRADRNTMAADGCEVDNCGAMAATGCETPLNTNTNCARHIVRSRERAVSLSGPAAA